MKTLFFTVLSFLIIATSSIAQKPKTEVVKETRDLSGFSSIYSYSSIDIFITQGEHESVIVETNEEFLKQVITSVNGTRLTIKVEGNINNPEKFNIYITVKNLRDVRSSGSGDIESQGSLNFKTINFKLNGSGDLDLTLKTDLFSLENNGSGDVDLKGEIKELKISSFGSGDIEANNIDFDKCLVSMSGSGDIEFKGSANLFNIDLAGSGDLECASLKVKEANINSVGSGDIELNVTETLNLKLAGSGDFKLIGNPTNKNITVVGTGNFN